MYNDIIKKPEPADHIFRQYYFVSIPLARGTDAMYINSINYYCAIKYFDYECAMERI